MERSNQRAKLCFRNVLQFIDEEDNCCISFLCSFAKGQKESLKINVKIAAIGKPPLRGDIKANGDYNL